VEVLHPKAFDDICKENTIYTVEQAVGCEQLWSEYVQWDFSMLYTCHKYIITYSVILFALRISLVALTSSLVFLLPRHSFRICHLYLQ
jgi:hypothetical protein